jgi:hypothetical protein
MPAVTRSLINEDSSPALRKHIRRVGQYVPDMDELPSPLNPQPLPFELAL